VLCALLALLCAVEVSAISAVRSLKQRKLEERIQRTEFGKSMLSAVKAQLKTGAKSFDRVQDFIDQVYKRVESEQASEGVLHDQRMEECKMKLSQLLEQSQQKDALVANLQQAVGLGENVTSRLPAVLAEIEASRAAAKADLRQATRLLRKYNFRRNNSYETYTREFQEAFDMVLAVQRIVHRMNVFFPSENPKDWSAESPPTPIVPDTVRFQEVSAETRALAKARALANNFFSEFGPYHSEAELNRFMETIQSLNQRMAEVIKANKNVDDLREILVFLDTRLRQYTESINERESTAQKSVTTFRAMEEKNAADARALLEQIKANHTETSRQLRLALKQLHEDRNELDLQLDTVLLIKRRLKIHSDACQAQTAQDQLEAKERAEQLRTLQALRIVVGKHITEQEAVLNKAARDASDAHVKFIQKQQQELADARQRLASSQAAGTPAK